MNTETNTETFKKKRQRFLLGIPTINRADLLNPTLLKYMYEDNFVYDIFIVDNGNQDIVKRDRLFEIYRPKQNLGVAGSWNLICHKAHELGYEQALILNDDIYLGKQRKEVEALIMDNYNYDLINSTKDFCSFIIRIKSFLFFGDFDEKFYPAYFEDNDYKYRLKLQLGLIKETTELDPQIYRHSMTIKKNADLNSNYVKNYQRYLEKWGGLPKHEVFTKPFNK